MRVTGKILVGMVVLLAASAAWAQAPPGGMQMSPEMQRRFEQFRRFRDQHKYTFQLRSTVTALGELAKSTKCPLTPDQAKKVVAVLKPLGRKPKLTQDQAKVALKALKAPLTPRQLTEIGRISRDQQARRRGGMGGMGGGKGGPGMGGMGGGKGGPGMGGMGSGKGGPGMMGGMGGGKGGPGMGGMGGGKGGFGMGGGKGGPGMGGGKGGAGRSSFDPARMKDFNPFAPPRPGDPMGQMGQRRLKETMTALEKKASGKK